MYQGNRILNKSFLPTVVGVVLLLAAYPAYKYAVTTNNVSAVWIGLILGLLIGVATLKKSKAGNKKKSIQTLRRARK